MKEKLLSLKYKPWTEIDKEHMKKIADIIAEKEMDDGIYGKFYMKFKQQELQYPDGMKNAVAIVCCVVLDNDDDSKLIDAFCVPAYPFFVKSFAEMQCFHDLVNDFLEELGLTDDDDSPAGQA